MGSVLGTEMTTETTAASVLDTDETDPAVTERVDVRSQAGDAFEWQRFWIRLQQSAWSTLAVVPADSGVDVHGVVKDLVDAGRQAGSRAVSSVDAAGVPASRAQEMIRSFQKAGASDRHVVVACDALADNPATLAIARAVSGVLVVARLGESRISAAKAAVDAIGRERVIAGITLQPAR